MLNSWKTTIFQKVQKNWIVRFLATHLLITLVILIVCLCGFFKAFEIVRKDIQENTSFALTQGISKIEHDLLSLRTIAFQIVRDERVQTLGQTENTDENYPLYAFWAVNRFQNYHLYYSTSLDQHSFMYFDIPNRFLHRGSTYRPETFCSVMSSWGISEEEWNELNNRSEMSPFFADYGESSFLYAIPCTKLFQTEKIGTLYFRISDTELLSSFSFLENEPEYTLIVADNEENILFCKDDLGIEWHLSDTTQQGSAFWQEGRNLMWEQSGDTSIGLHYILILPKKSALLRLNTLMLQCTILLIFAGLLSSAIALYFSLRRGRPINELVQALGTTEQPYEQDLQHLSGAVQNLVLSNEELQRQQARDLPALQKTFFHNLLKSDFVSRAEMEYLAQRAQIRLTDTLYCAADLRLYPQIDTEAIDGQTVEDARILQQAVSARINQLCARPVWTYKRNTLVTLYVFEIRDQEPLLQIMQSVSDWLQMDYHADSRWGVSMPCNNLIDFWKSAEQATAALNLENATSTVQIYDPHFKRDDNYYLPYTVESRLDQSLRTGDEDTVKSILDLLQTENTELRHLGHRQFSRLNSRLIDLLTERSGAVAQTDSDLQQLNELALQHNGNSQLYFEQLNSICMRLCHDAVGKKNARLGENVRMIESYIRANYRDPGLCLSMVSAEFHLSEGYISSLFKKEAGINFAEYLEQLRVKAACILLQDGAKVQKVSEQVGYNSIQSFRRAFKRVLGVSPSEYAADPFPYSD